MKENMRDYILNMNDVEFYDKFSKMAHSMSFSAIMSRVQNEKAFEELRDMCREIGVPKYIYESDEDLDEFLKIVGGRMIDR